MVFLNSREVRKYTLRATMLSCSSQEITFWLGIQKNDILVEFEKRMGTEKSMRLTIGFVEYIFWITRYALKDRIV